MGIVYILRSLKNLRYYIGSTNNMDRRLIEHNLGHSPYDRVNKPFVLIFQQEYLTLLEARRIEIKIKRAKSRKLIEQILIDKEIKLKV